MQQPQRQSIATRVEEWLVRLDRLSGAEAWAVIEGLPRSAYSPEALETIEAGPVPTTPPPTVSAKVAMWLSHSRATGSK